MKRVGIFGGSFDPIHSGHAIIANIASQSEYIDEVWIMVSRKNPLKERYAEAGEKERLEMAALVAQHCENVKVSDFEMSLPSPSYSYDTLIALKKKYPENSFFLIIGSDSLQDFDRWKKSDQIKKEFGLLVYPRPGYPINVSDEKHIKYLTDAPEIEISSTRIREFLKEGKNVNYLLPISVAKYIKEHDLYK